MIKGNLFYNKDEILQLDLPPNVKETFKEGFGKRFYFGYKDSCRVGTLCGLESKKDLSVCSYILEKDGNEMFIPIWQNLRRM